MSIALIRGARAALLSLAFAAAIPAIPLHAAAAPQAMPAMQPFSADELQEAAVDAYLYAYPLVLMDITRKVSTSVAAPAGMQAPMNRFAHVPVFPDDKFDVVVRPNADTLYSSLWFDVSKEPLIVSVPDSRGRYYLLPLMDMWTDVFASPGTRTTGNGAQRFAIVGPGWQGRLPAGVTAYRSPTPIGWMIGRTQTNGAADYGPVREFQAGIQAAPLSAWGKPARTHAPAPATAAAAQRMDPPVRQAAMLDGLDFFRYYARLAALHPPHAHDYPMLARLERLGVVAGDAFDPALLPAATQAALKAAPALAQQRVAAAVRQIGVKAGGWRNVFNPIGTYGTDYVRRAAIAYAALGANTVEDALYPSAFTDADGKPFDSGARYVMHFEKDQLPPVRAFWSLSMYNDRQFFAANPAGRYAVGDRDALRYNADGSLDLLIQRDPPDDGMRANWLPTPQSGGFSMNMRLYWPRQQALDGNWTPPPVKRIQ